jgi:hypothetical protein
MNRNLIARILHFTGVAAMVIALAVFPAIAGVVSAESLASTPAIKGYIDHAYGSGVKAEPTADGAESKLWFNDGIWWGILFNPTSAKYEIYRLDWGSQNWTSTGIVLDSRSDTASLDVPPKVDTRADVLWDQAANKLYIASHIKVDNPSKTNNPDNWARLYRYSYSAGSKTYTLDGGFPVHVNQDKTEVLVIDKDASGRLWVAYVSRVPVSGTIVPYKVFVNATVTAGNDQVWGTPIDMSTISPNAIVDKVDAAALVAFGSKIGVMWSNSLDGKFYFAEHANSSAPGSGWNVQPVNVSGVKLTANDHLKMVANSAGQVFVGLKTDNTAADEPLVGVLARDTDGSFSFAQFSTASSLDTRPTIVLNESTNRIHLFVASNESGGVICTASLAITSNLSDMAFASDDCKGTVIGSAEHFISDTVYTKLDNVTTSKRNVTNASGIVAMASDDVNGGRYLHNVIGGGTINPPAPAVVQFTPAQGATVGGNSIVVTARFNQAMDPASITAANFKVSGPGGPVPGNISYDAMTFTARFESTGALTSPMAVNVQLTTGIKAANGASLPQQAAWSFTYQQQAETLPFKLVLPIIHR